MTSHLNRILRELSQHTAEGHTAERQAIANALSIAQTQLDQDIARIAGERASIYQRQADCDAAEFEAHKRWRASLTAIIEKATGQPSAARNASPELARAARETLQ